MAKYTDDELAAAGRQLAGAIGAIGGRLDALESAPYLEQMTNTWSEGQDYARSRSYSAAELAELEKYMVERGVGRLTDAIRLSRIQPESRFYGGLEGDDVWLLMDGDEESFLRRAVPRAIRSAR